MPDYDTVTSGATQAPPPAGPGQQAYGVGGVAVAEETPEEERARLVREAQAGTRQSIDIPMLGRLRSLYGAAPVTVDAFGHHIRTDDIPLSTYQEMRADSTIAAGLRLMTAPILSSIRKATINCDDRRMARFAEALTLENGLLYDVVQKALSSLWMGISLQEKVWVSADLELVATHPNPRTGRASGETVWSGPALVYDRLVDVNPQTVPWLCKTPDGQLDGFAQTGPRGITEISRGKSYVYSYDPEFGNLWGRPRIRDAHPYWVWKNWAAKAWQVWVQQKFAPNRVLRFPTTQNADGTNNNDVAIAFANGLQALMNVALPNTKELNPNGTYGDYLWKFEELPTTDRGDAFIKYFDRLCLEILRAIFVPERTFTEGQFGTKAEAESHANLFLLTLDAELFAQVHFAEVELLRPLLVVNFGADAVARTPASYTVPGLGENERLVLYTILTTLLANPLNQGAVDLRTLADTFGVPTVPVEEMAPAASAPPAGGTGTRPVLPGQGRTAAGQELPFAPEEPRQPQQPGGQLGALGLSDSALAVARVYDRLRASMTPEAVPA